MKKVMMGVIGVLSFISIIALPYVASADHNAINAKVFEPTILQGPILLCVGAQSGNTGKANFPVCSNLCDLVAQIANVIYFTIGVVIWIVTPILIMVGGMMIMVGRGNPESVGRGRKTITGAIIGVLIMLCAWLIVFTFVSAFGQLGKYVGGFGGNGGQVECM